MTAKQYQELDLCIHNLYKVQAAHQADVATVFALEHVIATLENLLKEERQQGCQEALQQAKPQPYKATALEMLSGWAPSQWNVTAKPKPLYIRYRFGHLTVQEDLGDEFGKELLSLQYGDPMDGRMGTDEMQKLTKGLIDWSLVKGLRGDKE